MTENDDDSAVMVQSMVCEMNLVRTCTSFQNSSKLAWLLLSVGYGLQIVFIMTANGLLIFCF